MILEQENNMILSPIATTTLVDYMILSSLSINYGFNSESFKISNTEDIVASNCNNNIGQLYSFLSPVKNYEFNSKSFKILITRNVSSHEYQCRIKWQNNMLGSLIALIILADHTTFLLPLTNYRFNLESFQISNIKNVIASNRNNNIDYTYFYPYS